MNPHPDTEVGQRSGRGAEAQVEAVSTQQDTEEAKASGTRDCTRPGVNQAHGIRQRGLTPERRTRDDATISGGNGEGDHLFPYRTQKLSPSAPMVLGWKRPGRVGRRRIPHGQWSHVLHCPIFLRSSMAEHPAVNRVVAGSSPAGGANDFL